MTTAHIAAVAAAQWRPALLVSKLSLWNSVDILFFLWLSSLDFPCGICLSCELEPASWLASSEVDMLMREFLVSVDYAKHIVDDAFSLNV